MSIQITVFNKSTLSWRGKGKKAFQRHLSTNHQEKIVYALTEDLTAPSSSRRGNSGIQNYTPQAEHNRRGKSGRAKRNYPTTEFVSMESLSINTD